MTKQQAVYAAYLLAEALNQPEMRKHLQLLFGTAGIEGAKDAIKTLAETFGFEPPVIGRN